MAANGHINGNKIRYSEQLKAWVYLDGELADKIRICPKCKQMPNKNGHDACFGTLPGVENACCGHGVKPGYINFKNGVKITFKLLDIEK